MVTSISQLHLVRLQPALPEIVLYVPEIVSDIIVVDVQPLRQLPGR